MNVERPKNGQCEGGKKICGGEDDDQRICVPSAEQCPINGLKILESAAFVPLDYTSITLSTGRKLAFSRS